jgi:Family of unknown function (DUF5989)
MRFLRHLGGFLRELWAFARANKAWWIVPVVVVLLLITVLVVSVSTVSPFIYSLF